MDKKGIDTFTISVWIIAIIVLIIALVSIMILSGKGQGAIDYIKNLIRFGR